MSYHFVIFRCETTEEGQRTYRLKHCKYNYKDEDNSLKTLKDKNYQTSSQKFRQQKRKKYEASFKLKDHHYMWGLYLTLYKLNGCLKGVLLYGE